MKDKTPLKLFTNIIETSQGKVTLIFSQKKELYMLILPGSESSFDFPEAPLPWPDIAQKISTYFNGKKVDFDCPVDHSDQTVFHKKVVEAVKAIPYGETRSYRDIARDTGSPFACRSVGSVLAANRCPVIIPCHRVIRSDGKNGNYSGGKEWKEFLLRLEQNK